MMYLKWFNSKEEAETAISIAMEKLQQARDLELTNALYENFCTLKGDVKPVADNETCKTISWPENLGFLTRYGHVKPQPASEPLYVSKTQPAPDPKLTDRIAAHMIPMPPTPHPTDDCCGQKKPEPEYAFVPKKDITAWELATILARLAPAISQEEYDKLDYNEKRHFKPE